MGMLRSMWAKQLINEVLLSGSLDHPSAVEAAEKLKAFGKTAGPRLISMLSAVSRD
jgi:hypothetical protein